LKALSYAAFFAAAPVLPGGQAFAQTLTTLARFKENVKPVGSLIADGAGNLYGTTSRGASNDYGIVFELSPPSAGQKTSTQTILVSFKKKDGAYSVGNMIFDSAGNLYGTASEGGASNQGSVFELTPPAAGKTAWTETVLFSFGKQVGEFPGVGPVFDRTRNLDDTTLAGGAGYGTVFELTPPAAGQTAWSETVLASFDKTNGAEPGGGLTAHCAGNPYGMTEGAGKKPKSTHYFD
jgi:uncharacterized repeat protein (TIGR03803 family)